MLRRSLFKQHRFHMTYFSAPCVVIGAVEYATLEWIARFNNRRLPKPIGNIQPAEAEAKQYAAKETRTMAAKLTLPLKTRCGSPKGG